MIRVQIGRTRRRPRHRRAEDHTAGRTPPRRGRDFARLNLIGIGAGIGNSFSGTETDGDLSRRTHSSAGEEWADDVAADDEAVQERRGSGAMEVRGVVGEGRQVSQASRAVCGGHQQR